MSYNGDELDYFEIELHNLKFTYIKEGHCFYHIWKDCLWKRKASSFTAYCKNEFGVKWYQVKNKVNASRIASSLLANGFNILPTSQHQCKVLQLLETEGIDCIDENPQDRIYNVWKEVTENYSEEKITGKVIKDVIATKYPQFIPERKKVDVFLDVDTAYMLSDQARDEDTSMNQLIIDMIHDRRGYDDEIEDVDCDIEAICQENFLLDKLRQVCNRIKIKVNQVLEFICQEDNLKNLMMKGHLSQISNTNLELTIDQLAERLEINVELLARRANNPDFLMARDPDGLYWYFDNSTKLFNSG